MTSTVYRQTSVADPEKLAIDGANRLYWKWPVQRLDAETVRDRILATSGVLRDTMYGPPVGVKADDAGQIIVDGDESRRSIYVRVKRTQPVAMLKAFDAPVMEVNCERRPSSTVAPQSLMLMNSDFILRHAKTFAERLRKDGNDAVDVAFDMSRLRGPILKDSRIPAQVAYAWRLAYGRPATESELVASLEFLAAQIDYLTKKETEATGESKDDAVLQAMTNLCQVLLSSNEFLYVD